jgi:copper homeostasis protein
VFVLIRPRAGGFVYSEVEIAAMTGEIELAGSVGVAGIVTGALNADRSVDVEHTRILVKAAAGLPVTFHRAFDSTVDPSDALEQVIDAGASRVLTSGGAATALEGADAIATLVDQAGERLSIVAGGGIREHNVRDVVQRSGAREIHARLVDQTRMRNLVAVLRGRPMPTANDRSGERESS